MGHCVGINGNRPREGRSAVRARAAKSATLPCHSIAASACFCDSVISTCVHTKYYVAYNTDCSRSDVKFLCGISLFISSESKTGVNKYLSVRFLLLCGSKADPQSTRTVLLQFTKSSIIV